MEKAYRIWLIQNYPWNGKMPDYDAFISNLAVDIDCSFEATEIYLHEKWSKEVKQP